MKASFCGKTELHHVRKWRQFDAMPSLITSTQRTVPLIYYLCRDGQLQHPHFMEVPIPPSRLLLLRDFMNRLNFLRGRGMAAMYSWSSKRSYKNGFVWQDLSERDVVHPISGGEYVLKGSELQEIAANSRVYRQGGESVVGQDGTESNRIGSCSGSSNRRKNQWSLDAGNYIVYKNSNGSSVGTQTEEVIEGKRRSETEDDWNTTEVSREESPPSPEYSPEKTAENGGGGSGRIKATAVLRQLILCGSLPTMKNTNKEKI